jgi:hypothetical protein
MSGKRITIGGRPSTATPLPAADSWVSEREINSTPAVPMKRLTIDIPEDLHRKIKAATAARGAKMADEVRELLMQKYGKS